MSLRTRLAVGWIVPSILISIAACGGSATPSPSAASSSPAGSGSVPSIAIPSALASALASAATSASSGGQGSVPDAGSLVTADMAASVIGGSPTKVPFPGVGSGLVSIASYATTGGDTLTVLVEQVPGAINAAALQAAIAMEGASGQLQPISDLGDAAGKVIDAHGATVAFFKGNLIVAMVASAASMAGTDVEAKLEALARQVASKL